MDVIVVADGDNNARRAVEAAGQKVGARVISSSGGNPTAISPAQAVSLIRQAAHGPVVVMADDSGHPRAGEGEQLILEILRQPDMRVLGLLVPAISDKLNACAIRVDCSVTADGSVIDGGVDKAGQPTGRHVVYSDTVYALRNRKLPFPVVGIGDIGKMHWKDDYKIGAPVTTRALKEIIKRSGQL